MLMTGTRKETLERVFYIYYPVQFKKNAKKTQVSNLIDSRSEINAIHPTFVKKPSLPISPIEIGA